MLSVGISVKAVLYHIIKVCMSAPFSNSWYCTVHYAASMPDCLNGPGVCACPVECRETSDFDSDGDVDLRDWAQFQNLAGMK